MSATNRGAERRPHDDYQTPSGVIHDFLKWVDWGRVETFLEPCAGAGNILRQVPGGVVIRRCELYPKDDHPPSDFLATEFPRSDFAAFNPPFSLAQEFITKALDDAMSVAALVRLNFWGSGKRRDWWNDLPPVTHQLVVTPRPSFTGSGTDSCEYAWIAWDRAGVLRLPRAFFVLG